MTDKLAVPPKSTLQLLLAALRAVYLGDPSTPGLVIAQIGESEFYISIVRYRAPLGEGKWVIHRARGSVLGGVLREVATDWMTAIMLFQNALHKAEVAELRARLEEVEKGEK